MARTSYLKLISTVLLLSFCVIFAGFKKEQLKVHTNNKGYLIVEGERPVDGSKWSRFKKEVGLPEDCDVKEIRAKFSHGVLSILIPKPLPREATEASIWGVKISKKRAFKVAVIVVVAVMLVAIGNQIAKLVHRNPLVADN